jgi:hypothetical protein
MMSSMTPKRGVPDIVHQSDRFGKLTSGLWLFQDDRVNRACDCVDEL